MATNAGTKQTWESGLTAGAPPPPGFGGQGNLSRFAGVSGAGARKAKSRVQRGTRSDDESGGEVGFESSNPAHPAISRHIPPHPATERNKFKNFSARRSRRLPQRLICKVNANRHEISRRTTENLEPGTENYLKVGNKITWVLTAAQVASVKQRLVDILPRNKATITKKTAPPKAPVTTPRRTEIAMALLFI